MPMAMARSKRLPLLGSYAGAKFTVMRRLGNSNLELIIALRTRSLLSLTAVSGKPTILNAGRPFDRCTSTETRGAFKPSLARVLTIESDIRCP